ncbi:LacI family DNA-binding transcriptional regulator [Terrabacter terrae]|uniref:LacI family DNA-binding transcriptional regulator n=1 Tax=Terrabacter terrae TaxID=318434 RepID=A0ABP5FU19_9MICO
MPTGQSPSQAPSRELESPSPRPSPARPAGRRRVSMDDVAQHAGVSAQTVSRVSNGYPGVVESTRRLVLDAMRELGYRPNSAARALKRGEFRTIGVIMSTLATTGNMRTLEAITRAALEQGYAVTLLPPAPAQQEDGGFSRVGEDVVDGVIVVMERHQLDESLLVLPPGMPAVVADTDLAHVYPVVDTDQDAGARSAVAHLLELGHRTVWHVAGPEESFSAGRRANAWRALLQEKGIEAPPMVVGDWTAASGYQAGLRLADEPSCTAVFAANDQMALGILRALHEKGRRVPQDVSVVGFDDNPDSSSYLPPLTTVHQDFSEVGRRCIEIVLALLRSRPPDDAATTVELVPTHLVVRQSTANFRGP